MYANNYHTCKWCLVTLLFIVLLQPVFSNSEKSILYLRRRLQRGRGIGSLFGSLVRTLMPIGKKMLTSNTTKSIAKSVGRTLKDAAVGTAIDVLQGKSVEEAAKQNLNTTKRKIANAVKLQSKQPIKK